MNRRAVLITGSSGGVGRALCHAFRAAGFLVIGTDRTPANDGEPVEFVAADLEELTRNPAACEAFCREIEARVTARSAMLSVLINNAAYQIVGDLESVSLQEFERSQRINVTAPFVLAKAFAEVLRASSGSIVNVGSIHSRLTKPGFSAYSVSKSALAGLTRALALEFGGGVTVNSITPAALDTPMLRAGFVGDLAGLEALGSYHPVDRIGSPDEVAALAVFLCSENARFITGADLAVDGGIGVRLHDPM